MPPTPKDQPSQGQKATFAKNFDKMVDALESLYITGNQSGRIQFRQAWPMLAEKIFGAELMGFDEKGVTDKERRAVLETEAEDKRLALLTEIGEIREKSINNSMLELDYIKATMQKYGRDFAALIYSESLVEKFMPAPPEAKKETPVADKPVPAAVVPDVPDVMDDIAPIATESPPPPQKPAAEAPPVAAPKLAGAKLAGPQVPGVSYEELVKKSAANINLSALFNKTAAARAN